MEVRCFAQGKPVGTTSQKASWYSFFESYENIRYMRPVLMFLMFHSNNSGYISKTIWYSPFQTDCKLQVATTWPATAPPSITVVILEHNRDCRMEQVAMALNDRNQAEEHDSARMRPLPVKRKREQQIPCRGREAMSEETAPVHVCTTASHDREQGAETQKEAENALESFDAEQGKGNQVEGEEPEAGAEARMEATAAAEDARAEAEAGAGMERDEHVRLQSLKRCHTSLSQTLKTLDHTRTLTNTHVFRPDTGCYEERDKGSVRDVHIRPGRKNTGCNDGTIRGRPYIGWHRVVRRGSRERRLQQRNVFLFRWHERCPGGG